MNQTKAKFLAEHHCQWRGGVEHSSPTPQHGNMREEQHQQGLLSTASLRPLRTRSQPHRAHEIQKSQFYLPACRILGSLCSTCKPSRSIFQVFPGTIQSRDFPFLLLKKNEAPPPLVQARHQEGREKITRAVANGFMNCGFHGMFKSFPRYLPMTRKLLGLVDM